MKNSIAMITFLVAASEATQISASDEKCRAGTVYDAEICQCVPEVMCMMYCEAPLINDPMSCDCLTGEQYDLLYGDSCGPSVSFCPPGMIYNEDICECVSEVTCMLWCEPPMVSDPIHGCSCMT